MTVNAEYLSKDFMKWYHVNSARHDFQISKFCCCCSFWLIVLNIMTKNLKKLIIHVVRENQGLKDQALCGSDEKAGLEISSSNR